jgi:hypothetical protein
MGKSLTLFIVVVVALIVGAKFSGQINGLLPF